MNNPYNCDVLLLAAGFGKRLGELTKNVPKPLVEVAGRKLIDRNLSFLAKNGFKKIFINLHYLGDQIEHYVQDGKKWNLEVRYSREPVLLDTGGAVKKIRDKLFSERLLIFNSDIVVDDNFKLSELIDFHINNSSQITLVVREDPKSEEYGSLGLSNHQIVKFLNFTIPGEGHYKKVMFTGISIVEKPLLSKLPSEAKFSLTKDFYKIELERGNNISGYLLESFWCDAGTPERLMEADTYIKSR